MTPVFKKRLANIFSIAFVMLVAVFLIWILYPKQIDNFGIVVPGHIYRSGQPSKTEWIPLIQHLGLRTVLNLCNAEDSPEIIDAERSACAQMGVRLVCAPMPGDGTGNFNAFDLAMSVLNDPNAQPILVHCARGAYRTGSVIAAYRMLYQGWSEKDAIKEMRGYRVTHRDNHPGWPNLRKYIESTRSRKKSILAVDTRPETR